MKALLRELFPDLIGEFKEGDFCILNVLSFYDKTGFLLSSKLRDTSPRKFRPIIITQIAGERVSFVATTTDIAKRDQKIDISQCKISKPKEECSGIDLKRKYTWLFTKKTKSKRTRVYFRIDIHTLKYLKENNNFRICGTCPKVVLEGIEEKIKNLGEIYEQG